MLEIYHLPQGKDNRNASGDDGGAGSVQEETKCGNAIILVGEPGWSCEVHENAEAEVEPATTYDEHKVKCYTRTRVLSTCATHISLD